MKAIDKIIVPVDLEEHTKKLVEYAVYIANKLSADIILVHVVEPFRSIGYTELGASTIEEYTQTRINHSEEFLNNMKADFPSCKGSKVLKGEIVEEIITFAEDENAALIIIGTHGSKGLEKLLLGSVAERVVKNAHCPTLVMNPFKQ